MSEVRVCSFAVSIDGFASGADQDVDHPLGIGGTRLHEWVFETASWNRMQGNPGIGSGGVDDDFVARAEHGIGATVMGRNMFGPVRGAWGDGEWRGWWGDDPPFHHDVFVLTHHTREPLAMAGGTTFHFVTEGPEVALARAHQAAGDLDVRIGGGVATVQTYLGLRAIDELHLVIVPVLLGRGERLFDHVEEAADGYEVTEFVASPRALHVVLRRVD